MIISELVQSVVEETGRPDQQDMIIGIVQRVILQLHARGNFTQDLVEETIKVPTAQPNVRLTLPPRFRKFDTITIVNSMGMPLSLPCKNIKPSTLQSELGRVPLPPNYYVAGATYTVSSGKQGSSIAYLYTLYYAVPPVSELGADTWLTQRYPELVVNYALYKVHSKNGNDTKAGQAQALYQDQLTDLLLLEATGD